MDEWGNVYPPLDWYKDKRRPKRPVRRVGARRQGWRMRSGFCYSGERRRRGHPDFMGLWPRGWNGGARFRRYLRHDGERQSRWRRWHLFGIGQKKKQEGRG